MKSHSNSLAVAAVTALVLCLAPMAGAQSGSSTTGSSSNTDQANRSSNWNSNDQSSSTRSDRSMHASMRDAQKQHSAHKLMGRAVNGSNGEKLGDISDFVIDSQSGRIAYAVVSSGGVLGIGDTLRLVPAAALTPGVENTSASAGSMNASMSSDRFTVNVDKAKFDSAPKFKKDQIASLSDRRSEIDQYYGQTSDSGNTQWDRSHKKSSRQNDMSSRSTMGSQFVLASDVIGKEIRSGNDKVGKIDDLVIDWNAHRASILLDPDRDFVRTDRTTTATGDTRTTTTVDANRERGNGKYVVSFDKVMISGANRDAITTTLTRDQFTAANSATGSITGAMAGSSGVYAWTGWNDTSDWQASANIGSGSVTANSSGVNYSSNTASSSKDTNSNVSAFGRDSDVAGPGAGSIGTSPGGTTTDTGGATIAGNTNGRSVEMSRGNENMPNTTTSSTSSSSMASNQAPVDSVRQALNDSSLPSEAHQVQVSEQNGKLVLKGTVPSQNIKDTIEDKVEEAANGWDVDNQISVAEKD